MFVRSTLLTLQANDSRPCFLSLPKSVGLTGDAGNHDGQTAHQRQEQNRIACEGCCTDEFRSWRSPGLIRMALVLLGGVDDRSEENQHLIAAMLL